MLPIPTIQRGAIMRGLAIVRVAPFATILG